MKRFGVHIKCPTNANHAVNKGSNGLNYCFTCTGPYPAAFGRVGNSSTQPLSLSVGNLKEDSTMARKSKSTKRSRSKKAPVVTGVGRPVTTHDDAIMKFLAKADSELSTAALLKKFRASGKSCSQERFKRAVAAQ